jgi:hypothetical protein
MAKTFRPYEPDQMLLMPPSLADWVPEDHLAGSSATWWTPWT